MDTSRMSSFGPNTGLIWRITPEGQKNYLGQQCKRDFIKRNPVSPYRQACRFAHALSRRKRAARRLLKCQTTHPAPPGEDLVSLPQTSAATQSLLEQTGKKKKKRKKSGVVRLAED